MPSHVHAIDKINASGGTSNSIVRSNVNGPGVGQATDSRGSDAAHENTPPYQVVNYIIKT